MPSLIRRALIRLRGPRWVRVAGMELHLDPRQFMDRVLLQDGAWEPALTALIRRVVHPGDAALDVGAHTGFLTMVMAQAVGPAGRVVAVEPDPRAFGCLEAHLVRNGFDQVTALPLALGATEGTATLTLTRTLGWTSQHPNPLAAADATGTATVPLARGDRYAHLLGTRPLTFVKLDAEGAEPAIWQGLRETLSRHRPLVAMEVNYPSLRAAGVEPRAFVAELHALGYTEALAFPDLTPTDLTVERPLLVDALLVHPASPWRDRLTPPSRSATS